jgi:hypothetical protein
MCNSKTPSAVMCVQNLMLMGRLLLPDAFGSLLPLLKDALLFMCCRIQMLDAIRYMIVWNPLIFLIFSVLVSCCLLLSNLFRPVAMSCPFCAALLVGISAKQPTSFVHHQV